MVQGEGDTAVYRVVHQSLADHLRPPHLRVQVVLVVGARGIEVRVRHPRQHEAMVGNQKPSFRRPPAAPGPEVLREPSRLQQRRMIPTLPGSRRSPDQAVSGRCPVVDQVPNLPAGGGTPQYMPAQAAGSVTAWIARGCGTSSPRSRRTST